MANKSVFRAIVIYLFFHLILPEMANAQSSKEVLDNMLNSISQIKSLSYSTKITERIDGKIDTGINHVKVQFNPYKAYVKVTTAELLYVQGENGNKALVKSNSVPYFNVSLDPYSPLLRKGQHHTIFELGFSYFGDIVKEAYKNSGNGFENLFALKGSITWEGRDCHVVVIDYPEFKFVPYVVKPGEDLVKIANKLKVSDYMILERNPSVKDYSSVKAGQSIMVPNAYGKKTIIYIDKQNHLPIVQIIYDDKGIFAKYEFMDVKVNHKFADVEFTKGYKDYNFW